MNKYELNPTVLIDKNSNGNLRIRSGSGWTRGRFDLSPEGESVISHLFAGTTDWTHSNLVDSASEIISDRIAAEKFIGYLISENILVEKGSLQQEETIIREWSSRGWRTPAAHHISGFGMPFMPDDRGGADYKEIYSEMLKDSSAPPQPRAVKGIPENSILEIPASNAAELNRELTVQEVLENSKQVYAFEEHSLNFQEVHAILLATFKNQRYQKTGLGPAAMRSYPSGGSRHPLEVYLVSRIGSEEFPAGIYYFDPDSGNLHLINEQPNAGKILDEACFLKRGIRSSNFGVLISTRWVRHIWKYRYPRSYKMVLMEVGHSIQSLTFAAASQGVESYYCPSYNDSELNAICLLEDPFYESIAVAMSLGRNGLTLENYRDRYDTNA